MPWKYHKSDLVSASWGLVSSVCIRPGPPDEASDGIRLRAGHRSSGKRYSSVAKSGAVGKLEELLGLFP